MSFMYWLSDRWHSITCLAEMAIVLKTLVKNLCSYFFIVKNDQKCPNETIDCKGGEFGILYKASKWPVLYEMDNQWL